MDFDINIIDGGARYGLHPTMSELSDIANFYLFEVDSQEASRLRKKYEKKKNIIINNIGLYSRVTDLEINILKHKGLSGSLKINKEVVEDHAYMVEESDLLETIKVKADTVDRIFADKDIHFIKLDTEGTELEILKGAVNKLFTSLLAARVEVSFQRFYENQPLFGDLNTFMLEHGYELLNLDYDGKGIFQSKYTLNNRYGYLITCEAVWVKKRKYFFEKLKTNSTEAKQDLIRMALFLMLNNATDVALNFLQKALELNLNFIEYIENSHFKKLDQLIQILFKKLQYNPAITNHDLTIYKKIFNKDLKTMHNFYESEIFN